MFINEINDIKDENLKIFLCKALLNAPDYFFTVPASSSGKYHPYFAREECGLVKHTRCVVFYAECNAESFNFDEHEKDLLIIAAVLHDIKKQGNENRGKHTVWEHPELASNYVLDLYKENKDLISKTDANKISNAILCHMGKWAHNKEFVKNKKQFPLPNTLFENALQSADYIASRTELTGFNFREINETQLPANFQKLIVKKDVSDYKFDFGKYSGKTIRDVYEENFDYLKWILNKEDFNKVDVKNNIKQFIVENNISI
jgi:HD superfamily phosphohydrolase YqeK